MNPFLSWLREAWRLLRKDFRIVFWRMGRMLWRGKVWAIGGLIAAFVVALWGIYPFDRQVAEHVREVHEAVPNMARITHLIGWWGDFAQYNLAGFFILWGVGAIWKMRWFQRLAVATFVATLFAGLSCNALRFTMGRPRPYAQVEDKFYGIPGSLKGWEYHSFPSGHTSTAMGMATPIITAAGVWGIPAMAFSSTVAVSRVYKTAHYPTDVFIGGVFGIIYGVSSGWHLRAVRLRLRSRKRKST